MPIIILLTRSLSPCVRERLAWTPAHYFGTRKNPKTQNCFEQWWQWHCFVCFLPFRGHKEKRTNIAMEDPFIWKQCLGEGAFGNIYLVVQKSDNKEVRRSFGRSRFCLFHCNHSPVIYSVLSNATTVLSVGCYKSHERSVWWLGKGPNSTRALGSQVPSKPPKYNARFSGPLRLKAPRNEVGHWIHE